jgi:hypothetical protein
MTDTAVQTLACCCCEERTTGRQWHNRDLGYGLCTKCANYVATRMTAEEMHRNYGEAGRHYALPWRARHER